MKIYIDGMAQETKALEKTLDGSIRTTAQFTLGRRESGEGAAGVAVQDLRIYRRVLTDGEIKALAGSETLEAMLRTPPEKLNAIQQRFALNYYLQKVDPKYAELQNKAASLKAEYDAIADRSPTTMVMDEKPTPPFAFLLKRGQYDQKGEKLSPGVPKVLPPMPKDAPDNRLGLAKWLVAPENPLLARVTVNRFWQQLFGIGIVRTAEDFGVMGERPVNQPLLDWMAVEFRESGWDVKHMFKLMVMSAAYRQSDRITPAEARCRPGKPPHLARPPLPAGCRSDPRPGARRQRPAQPADRRPEREALPAARPLGSRQHVQRSVQAGHRPRPLPPQPCTPT